jgi:hypothetical protein
LTAEFKSAISIPVEKETQMNYEEKLQHLNALGFYLSTRAAFFGTLSRPEGLMDRAKGVLPGYEGPDLTEHAYVIWDPMDDVEGFMLWGDDKEVLLDQWFAGISNDLNDFNEEIENDEGLILDEP